MEWSRRNRRVTLRWIFVLSLFAAIVLLLAGCGDHPVPEHGTVTGRDYTPAWIQIIPGIPPMCSGNPPTCTAGTAQTMIPWPNRWDLTITDLNNKDWVGTVEVSHDVFDRCDSTELWPECSKKGME